MAATTGPLSTCSSPVLFLIAREWQCNKHLRRNLFTKSEFKNKATIGECFVSHLSELLYLRCQRSRLPDLIPLLSPSFPLGGQVGGAVVVVQEVLTVAGALQDWRYPELRLSLIFLPPSLPPY